MPANNLKERVELAKAKPAHISFASHSTSQRVSTEVLSSMVGIQMTKVPCKSGPAAVNAAATDKTILERFSALGFETAPASPEALAQRSKAETAKWAKAIPDAKIEEQQGQR